MNNKQVFIAHSALWAAYRGFTTIYLAAFALALGASNLVVGLLGAIPFLATIITQIPGAELAQHFPRIRVYITTNFISRLFWVPLALTPYYFAKPIFFIVLFYLFVKIGEAISDPSWTSVMAETVGARHRGSFVSKRFEYIGILGMVAAILGGLWLKQFPKESPLGFAIMFSLGMILAIIATLIMVKIKEPEYNDHTHHTVKEFFKITGPMRKFVFFQSAFNFSFMLASPLVIVYMLKTLDIGYFYFGIVTGIVTLSKIISSRYIGKLTDKYGHRSIAFFGYLGTALVPLLFLILTPETVWFLVPIQIYAGIVWAAADITSFGLLLDIADQQKRALQIAEYKLYTAIPLVVAPILGGWMSEHFTFILAGIPLIFVLSSILRALSSFLVFTFEEPRIKKHYGLLYVFKRAMHIHPGRGLVHAIHIVKKKH